MDPRLLDILCCPVSRQPLRPLRRDELAALAEAIGAGRVATDGGRRVAEAPVAALVTMNGRTIYRIEDDIPVLLADEAIATDAIEGWKHPRSAQTGAPDRPDA